VHALQRLGFIERVNQERAAKALPPLSLEEEEHLTAESGGPDLRSPTTS